MISAVESLSLAFSSGWASGINAYLVVLVLGIADKINDFDQIPNVLARWDVLAVAGFLYAMEFIADKIPYIDSTWDAISTAIRPTAGAVIGVLLAGDASTLQQAIMGVVGGGTALISHLIKSGSRLAINASPEPASNIGASLIEDLAVLGVVAYAIEHPRIAAGIAGLAMILGLLLMFVIGKAIRRGWRRWKQVEVQSA